MSLEDRLETFWKEHEQMLTDEDKRMINEIVAKPFFVSPELAEEMLGKGFRVSRARVHRILELLRRSGIFDRRYDTFRRRDADPEQLNATRPNSE